MPQILKLGSGGLNGENWKVYHPDGTHMFTCGEKKANWYLENYDQETGKPLATQINNYEIRLSFEPKGKGYRRGEIFGLSGRKIRCVVSGEEESLQRHHIVPYCYRSHFEHEYKSKNHHDVVLVTHTVHEEYELQATEFKNQLAEEYGVETLNELNLKYTRLLSEYSEDKVRMLSKLKSIFTSYGKIPQDVIENNLRYVSQVTGLSYKDKISKYNYIQLWKLYTLLKDYYDADVERFKSENSDKYDHGKLLVEKLDNHQKIEEFVKRWRTHFIETTNPQYMPKGWSVDFRVKVEI
jgi:hypothetical protein